MEVVRVAARRGRVGGFPQGREAGWSAAQEQHFPLSCPTQWLALGVWIR